MTVDRAHVLATPGMDAHSSYVALSRHRDGVDLHYGRDDFAGQDRLVRTLSRDRAKDMASDYDRADPAQSYAERRGITFRERVAEIVRKVVLEKVRNMFDGLRSPSDMPDGDGGRRPERETPERERSGTAAARRETEAPEGSWRKQPARGRAAMRELDRIIRFKTVLARTGLSRSTIYRKIAEGTFPAQLKISTNGTGWHESDINRWIADPVGWRPKGEFDDVR
jgi:predicted DNA-binding transcriptional regulator AlpA